MKDLKQFSLKEWKQYATNNTLPLSLIERYWRQIGWEHILKTQSLPADFLDTHIQLLPLTQLVIFQNLDEVFIIKHIDKLNFKLISEYQKLQEEFIYKYHNLINFKTLSKNIHSDYSNYLYEDFGHLMVWKDILSTHKIKDEFVEKFEQQIVWDYVLRNTRVHLIEKNLEKLFDKLGPDYFEICMHFWNLPQPIIQKIFV